jgi:hypothetical protein
VAGSVVEVAGDPGALLGDRQATLALRLALGAEGALSKFGEVLAPKARSLAGEPGDRPGEPCVQEFASREAAVASGGGEEVNAEQSDDGAGAAPVPRLLVGAARREQVQRGGGPERQRDRIAEAGQQRDRRRREHECCARRVAPGEERDRRACSKHSPGPVELSRFGRRPAYAAVR